jgi:lactoylglutathione lyase
VSRCNTGFDDSTAIRGTVVRSGDERGSMHANERADRRPGTSPGDMRVSQLRLAVTAADFDRALRFYRDVLGMPELGVFTAPSGGQVVILDAGRATLELADPAYAAYIDEVEVGERVAGHIRIALEVPDAAAATSAAETAGARVLAEPTTTPWNSSNARLEAPADLQITLFTELDQPE